MSREELTLSLKYYSLSGQNKAQIMLNSGFKNVFLNMHVYWMVNKNYCFSLGETVESHLSQ